MKSLYPSSTSLHRSYVYVCINRSGLTITAAQTVTTTFAFHKNYIHATQRQLNELHCYHVTMGSLCHHPSSHGYVQKRTLLYVCRFQSPSSDHPVNRPLPVLFPTIAGLRCMTSSKENQRNLQKPKSFCQKQCTQANHIFTFSIIPFPEWPCLISKRSERGTRWIQHTGNVN